MSVRMKTRAVVSCLKTTLLRPATARTRCPSWFEWSRNSLGYSTRALSVLTVRHLSFSSRLNNESKDKETLYYFGTQNPEQLSTTATSALPTKSHYLAPPSLNDVLRMEFIVDKTADEISHIWKEYHTKKNGVCAVIPAHVYLQLHTKATAYPRFLYPVPKEGGYEFIYSQFSGHCCHFTKLRNYQQHKEKASTCLTLTHYTDLQDSKGIVLMCGELVPSELSPLEAQFLANQVQMYYASSDPQFLHLVRQFNVEPDQFDYQSVIDKLQNTPGGLTNTVASQ